MINYLIIKSKIRPYLKNLILNKSSNMLDLADTTKTNNGLTAIINNGIISVSGTTTANSFLRIDLKGEDYYLKKIPAGTYKLSANNNQAIGTNDFLRFVTLGGANTTPSTQVPLNQINASKTFTLSEDLVDIQLQVRIQHPRTLDNFILKPKLEAIPY